jgi:hypothetical protein
MMKALRKRWLQECERGIADYRRALAEGEARGVSPEDVLRAYLDNYDAVLAVIPENPTTFHAIKLPPGILHPMRWGFVPVRDREEAASLSRNFGNVWRAH